MKKKPEKAYIETLEKHAAEMREHNEALCRTVKALGEDNERLRNLTADFDTGFIFNWAWYQISEWMGGDE